MKNEQLLIWLLSQGIQEFERSPMGGMIASLEMRAGVSKPCTYRARVNGQEYPCTDGIVVAPKELRDASGAVQVVPYGDWCPVCKGTGFIAVSRRDSRESITARPTTGHEIATRDEPDGRVLESYAIGIRSLAKMSNRGAAAIIEAYGHHGEIENQPKGRGRAWAVAHLTDTGRAIVADWLKAHEGAEIDAPYRILSKIETENAKSSTADMSDRLGQAVLESVDLLRSAEHEWESTFD